MFYETLNHDRIKRVGLRYGAKYLFLSLLDTAESFAAQLTERSFLN